MAKKTDEQIKKELQKPSLATKAGKNGTPVALAAAGGALGAMGGGAAATAVGLGTTTFAGSATAGSVLTTIGLGSLTATTAPAWATIAGAVAFAVGSAFLVGKLFGGKSKEAKQKESATDETDATRLLLDERFAMLEKYVPSIVAMFRQEMKEW